MTLKAKLTAAQMPLFAALVLLSVLSLGALARLGASSQEIVQKNYRSVLAAQRMKEAIERIEDSAARFPITGERDAIPSRLEPHAAVFERELGVEERNITESGESEIARLGQDFNSMAERLHRYRKSSLGKLLRAQQAVQASIDSLPGPVVILGITGEVLSLNRAAETVLGRIDSLADFEPELHAALEKILGHVREGKGPYAPRGLEETVRVKGPRYLLPSANPLRDEEGLMDAPIRCGGFGAHAKMPFAFEHAGPRLSPG